MACKKNYLGTLLGSYRLIAECGCGPIGCVYLGRHISSLKLPVAIKLFQSVQLSPHQCSQFLQEVRLLKKLKHPHILPILDAGFFEGFPYIVSEYAVNGSLEDYLRQQSSHLSLQESLRILSQIGQALHYAHQHEIIHRNLKANNILFNASGKALLADFGLEMYGQGLPQPCASQPLASTQRMINAPLTSDDTVSATALASEMHGQSSSIKQVTKTPLPLFAPEQAEGWIRQESDQYTLGRIAYQLLIGQVPFTTSDSSTMQLMHAAEPLSSHTEQVLYKAMAEQPTDRYTDVIAFVTALRASTIVDAAATPIVSSEPDRPRQAIKALQNENVPSSSEHNESIIAHQQTVPMLLPVPESVSLVALELAQEQQENEVAGTLKTSKTNLFIESRTGRDNQSGRNRYFYLRWVLAAIVCIAIITYAFSVLHAEILSTLYPAPHAAHISKISPMPSAYPSTPFTAPSPSPVPSPVAGANQGALPLTTPTPSPTPKPTQTPIIPPSLVVSPNSLNAQSDCTRRNGWVCTVTLTLAAGSQSPLNWSVSSNGMTGVSFKPSSGTLSSGESMVVTIFVPKTHCATQASFIFSGSSSSIYVPWSC
jgi:serine/threonine protein kinase